MLEACYRAKLVGLDSARTISIEWADGLTSHFHYVWLRQQHFNPAVGRADQAAGDTPRLPDQPESLQVKEAKLADDHLLVSWGDGRIQTKHNLKWLRDNAYEPAIVTQRRHKPSLWTAAAADDFRWHDFDEVMNDEESLFTVYREILDWGVSRLRGVPLAPGTVTILAERFGPVRVTDFGAISDIMSRPVAEAGRYANIGAGGAQELGPHTDEGWRYSPPGISFHVCLESTAGAGGESRLYDGFLAAERLRKRNPQAFDFLAKTPFRFAAARNDDERYFAYGRLIVTDATGELSGVRFSDRTLGSQDLPGELIEPAYGALRAFAKELYAPDLCYRHTLKPGECHVFDNHRILHGRSAFDRQAGPRRIQQCSVDREEFHNRLRILARKSGDKTLETMIYPNGALG